MRIEQQNHRLIIHDGRSECWIDPWGKDSLRVRMSAEPGMDDHDWALTEPVEATDVVIRSEVIDTTDPWYKGDEWAKYHQTGTEWTLTNGKITAKISTEGWITFLNQRGEVLTAEYWRNRDRINRYCVPLRIPARELKPIPGGTDFSLTARFEAYDDEMIFGMGQYQDRHLNKKGSVLELAHRNSQSSVPFFVSSRGYGFLWNNPAIGTAAFGTNVTEWSAKSTKKLDYFITAGIEANYTAATGRTPMMPEYGMGYWQCKLRYRTQEELQSYLDAAYGKAEQLKRLTDELFRYSLLFGCKELPLQLERYDASILLGQLLGESRAQLQQQGFTVQLLLPQQDVQIEADVTYLKRVFDNLFDNIRKYADPARPVAIAALLEDGALHVCLSNSVNPGAGRIESNKIGLRTCAKIMA